MDLHAKELKQQLIFFTNIFNVGNLTTWGFYYILLLRSSNNSIPLILFNIAFSYIGLMSGFFVATKLLSRVGYLNTFRLSNLGMVLTLLFAIMFINQIVMVSFLVSLFMGISTGFFWGPRHVFNIRELNKNDRGQLLNLLVSLGSIAEVALPFLTGSLIASEGYTWAFSLGAAIFLLGVIAPWKYNKKPADTFKLSELGRLAKRVGFTTYSGIVFTDGVLISCRDICLNILPFILIGSELGVGTLVSFIALIGAIISFIHRKDTLKRKVSSGYLGGSIITAFNLMLTTVWNLPALIIRGVGVKLGSSFFDPIDGQIDYYNSELILGNFRSESATEMLIWREFMLFVGRITTSSLCIAIILLVTIDLQLFLRLVLLISSLREITYLIRQVKLHNRLHIGSLQPSH